MKLSTEALADLVGSSEDLLVRASVLERLFDEAPDVAFFMKDRAGRYLAVNRSLADRHGLSKAHMVGKRPDQVCPGVFGDVPAEQDAKVLRTGRALVNHLEMQWLRPNHPCWCLTTKLPLRDGEGIVGLIGFSRDLQEPVPVTDVPGQFALVVDSFEKNCGEPASPSSLAKQSGLSPARFARIMKRIFGVTPSQFISQTRIKTASRLLRERDSSVADIALECGFSDHSAFTRAFRATMGLTPTQYREQVQDRDVESTDD